MIVIQKGRNHGAEPEQPFPAANPSLKAEARCNTNKAGWGWLQGIPDEGFLFKSLPVTLTVEGTEGGAGHGCCQGGEAFNKAAAFCKLF